MEYGTILNDGETYRKEKVWDKEGLFGPAMSEVPMSIQVDRSNRQLAIPDLNAEDTVSKRGSRRNH